MTRGHVVIPGAGAGRCPTQLTGWHATFLKQGAWAAGSRRPRRSLHDELTDVSYHANAKDVIATPEECKLKDY
jgi:hypothetical protein